MSGEIFVDSSILNKTWIVAFGLEALIERITNLPLTL